MDLGLKGRVALVFGGTVFLGAFLLFQVQLVIAKHILPWYGGVPMVWTTCMLCFQLLLLAGYAYAHLLVQRLPDRAQRFLHLVLVLTALTIVAILTLRWGVPLLPGTAWKPTAQDAPAWHIVRLLLVAVAFPFFVASTTTPLIQAWLARSRATFSPYRYYALSNAGSLLALLAYPTLVEVYLPLRAQAWLWAAMFGVFCVGVVLCALTTRSRHAEAPPGVSTSATAAAAPPTPGEWLLWTALAATPSLLLLATTNYMSQEIAVVPMLWIAPLALYLLSFVATFDSDRWSARGVWAALLALGITLSAFALERGVWAHVLWQIGIAAFTLFAACMVCHGALARSKPAAMHLTSFYLALTVGGALGGAFVSLLAPAVFPGTWEYPLGLVLAGALALVAFARDRGSPVFIAPRRTIAVASAAAIAVLLYVFRERLPWTPPIEDAWLFGVPAIVVVAGLASSAWLARRGRGTRRGGSEGAAAIATGVAALALVAVGATLGHIAWGPLGAAVEHSRSFYGIVHVEAVDPGGDGHVVRLRHGRIVHGKQYRAPDHVGEPTAYYGRDSGVGLAIEHHPRRETGLRIGVVGLGVGTLAAYGRAGDFLKFYELNPDVTRLAGPSATLFTFLRDTEARLEVEVGDARVALEAELARGDAQRFDVLAIDAFSSDAIPGHLLTREAVAVYLAHLREGGILAVHITNRYIGLEPVIRGHAKALGLAYVFVAGIDGELTWRNDWALLARDPARLAVPEIRDAALFELSDPPVVHWTDDYSNLVRLLKL